MLNKAVFGRSKSTQPMRSQSQVSQLTNSSDMAKSASLTEVLQTSLDTHQLLSTYADYVRTRLAVDAIQFVSDDQLFTLLGRFDEHQYQHAVMLYADQDYLGQMVYQLKQPLSQAQKNRLEDWHRQLTFPLRNTLTFAKLHRMAVRDHLTGLGNRALLEEVLSHLHVKQQREGERTHSVMLLDLDGFKEVNDEFGHHQGDNILKIFAELLKSTLRDSDQVFRYGGDEFVIVMEDTSHYQAQDVYNRIRRSLTQCEILSNFKLSTSAGTAQLESFLSVEQTMQQADQRLYQAKHGGKNRHCGLQGCA